MSSKGNTFDWKKLKEDAPKYAKKLKTKQLAKLVKTLSKAYYEGKPKVSDEIFDILKDMLAEKDPENPVLKEIGAPVYHKKKVKLPVHMPSLEKAKAEDNALDKWIKEDHDGPFVISDKLDGESALFYRKDGEDYLYTRGDGDHGHDISHMIPYVIDKKILDKIPDDEEIAIRGELIITKKKFKQFEGIRSNVRNTVVGIAGAKTLTPERKKIAKAIEFVPYTIMIPLMKPSEQLKKLEKWGFKVVYHQQLKKISNKTLSEILLDRRKNGEYDIDGLVVADDHVHEYAKTGTYAEHALAFKMIFTDDIMEVKVIDVEWRASKYGYMKPRIVIEPVKIGGATIIHATANNAKFILDNKIGPGAIVKLIRSNDVIPKIIEVVKPAAKAKLPEGKFKWSKHKVDIISTDDKYKRDIRIKRITQFFRVLGVMYLSEGIVTRLYDADFTTVKKIIQSCPDHMSKVDGLGNKMATKICGEIKKALDEMTLPLLMEATHLFGRGFGEKRFSAILKVHPNIIKEKKTKDEIIDDLLEVEGVSTITATQFAERLSKFRKFLNKMKDVIDVKRLLKPPEKPKIKKKGLLKDEKIVFTGIRPTKEQENQIIAEGGEISSGVSKNTTILVTKGDKNSGKAKKAADLGVTIFSVAEFEEKYGITIGK